MPKICLRAFYGSILVVFSLFLSTARAWAAPAAAAAQTVERGMTLWQLFQAGGSVMIFLALMSIAGTASVIYHWMYVREDKLAPQDFIENLLALLERKEFDKASSLCKQQPNLISSITLEGLNKLSKGHAVVEDTLQHEGRSRIERMWQNLSYLGDVAVIAPMLGLLGTILGMIQAFNYQAFKAGIVRPLPLAQGLAKAMITTAFGLIIAIPVLLFYAYFRGKVSAITTKTERVMSEINHHLNKTPR